MAEPLPSETAANLYERTVAQIDELQAYQPRTDAERRRCATELVKLRQAQLDLAKEVISESAGRQIAEVIGNEYVKPTDAARMNGSNGHAPIAQPNWAEMLAQQELRFETRFATLKEEFAAKSGGLTDEELDGLARGMVPFLRETIANAVNPLIERIAELEATATRYEGIWEEQRVYHPNMMATYGGNLWICEEVNSNARPGQSDAWRLMHKTKARR